MKYYKINRKKKHILPPLLISFVKSTLVFTKLLPGVPVTFPLNFVKKGVPLNTVFNDTNYTDFFITNSIFL